MKTKNFTLLKDMKDSIELIRQFNPARVIPLAELSKDCRRIIICAEGSSRLFPGGLTTHQSLGRTKRHWSALGGRELLDLLENPENSWENCFFLLISNSGRTSELIDVAVHLNQQNHPFWASITVHEDSALDRMAPCSLTLNCGEEGAVAATKSVMEQALVIQSLYRNLEGLAPFSSPRMKELSQGLARIMEAPVNQGLVDSLVKAGKIYMAGRQDGVAAELSLKTLEILRKSAEYLPGTLALHGIEEVMGPEDVIVFCGDYKADRSKIEKHLLKGTGIRAIYLARGISPDQGLSPQVMEADLEPYLILGAGWRLLVAAGLQMGHDLDHPQRARKVGNEME
ncbi:MAG: SIS domain-containing protein [Spirochaetaceae bacterium]|jgi:glucosamine--fructose-6-phosphate aminotransferase (isomerizing)|nr:SIS domain-containing protein [Spirochaetaceae bacterium]